MSALQTPLLLINSLTHPLVPTVLRRRHTQTVRDRSVIVMKNFLNPNEHQTPIIGSKVTAILLKGWIWPIGEASAGEGLRLQPAQQACFRYSPLRWLSSSSCGGLWSRLFWPSGKKMAFNAFFFFKPYFRYFLFSSNLSNGK